MKLGKTFLCYQLLLLSLVLPSVKAFWPWDILFEFICVPLFFMPFCKDKSLGTVRVDFYRTFKESKKLGIIPHKEYSISKLRIYSQMASLNHWYRDRVKFRLGDIRDYTVEWDLEDLQPNNAECSLLDEQRVNGFFNTHRISAVYIDDLHQRTSSGELTFLNGCAFIDVTLGDATGAPVTMMSTTTRPIDFLPFVDANTLAATLAHEVGHIFGFKHTAGSTSYINVYTACGESLEYPTFAPDEDVFERNGITYRHKEWGGRTNIMARLTSDQVQNPLSVRLFGDGYDETFTTMVECWFERSN